MEKIDPSEIDTLYANDDQKIKRYQLSIRLCGTMFDSGICSGNIFQKLSSNGNPKIGIRLNVLNGWDIF